MNERHQRREFLARALALVASPILLSAACKESEQVDFVGVPDGFFSQRHIEAAMMLGEAYLTAIERTTERDDVLEACQRTVSLINSADSDEAAVLSLQQAMRADALSEEHLVDLEGWMLARTELEVCALLWADAERLAEAEKKEPK